MSKKINLINFGLTVLVCFILLTQTSVAAFKNVTVGSTAPNITLKNADGEEISLDNIYTSNKLVVLVFWATWSPRSIQEIKDLQKFYESYNEKGVEVYAVNVDNEEISAEDMKKAMAIVNDNNIKFNVVFDEGLATFRGYGVVAIPSTAIINSSGDITKDYASYATFAYNDIKDNIEYELGIKERPKDVEVAEETKKYKPVKAALLRYGLGKKLIDRGMSEKAVREFKKSSELDEKFALPHVGLGEVYYDLSQKQKKKAKRDDFLAKSQEEFSKALELDAESLPALAGLALALLEVKNNQEAQKHLDNALQIEPNYTPAISAMGMLFKNKGEIDKAIEQFNTALELNPNQPEVHYLKAITYKEAGKNKLAITSFKKSFKYLLKQVSLAMKQEHKEVVGNN
jgi:tetratricopeptide (TPR) repeat protein